MSEDAVLLSVDGPIATITLNRPESMNTINPALLLALERICNEIAGRDDVLVAILTSGVDRVFTAGLDVKAFAVERMAGVGRTGRGMQGMLTRVREINNKLEHLPVPVIAAIKGYCYGGGIEFALVCDIRLAADNARFSLPEVKIGAVPDMGSTQRLPRLIGWGKAREIVYTGMAFDAQEALRIGLVDYVYPLDRLNEEAIKLAQKIAANPPEAVQGSKRAMLAVNSVPLDAGLRIETETAAAVLRPELLDQLASATLKREK